MARPPEDEPFLNRWSKRKRAAEAPTEPAPEPDPLPEAAPSDTISDEELAALPAIEDLSFGTDIRPFLRKGVPQALRNAALRKMWLLTPAIRDHADPAVDYAWDWNTPGGVPGDGAAPSPERVAQMMREFLAPRPAPEPAPEADTQHAPEDLAELPTGEEQAPQAADMPPAAYDSTLANTSGGQGKTAQKERDAAQHLPKKKHGGALPS